MRISDWSSDVCSSDLDDGTGRRPGDIRTTRRGADPAATFVDRDPACRHPTERGATMQIARGSADEDAPTAGETPPESTHRAIPSRFASQFGVLLLDGHPDRPIIVLREDGEPRRLVQRRGGKGDEMGTRW